MNAGELHLRLLVEELVAEAHGMPQYEVGLRMNAIGAAAHALAAIGAIDRELGASIVRDAQDALVLRGHAWIEEGPRDGSESERMPAGSGPSLEAVMVTPENVVEHWGDHLRVVRGGESFAMPLPAHADMSAATPVRTVTAIATPVDASELVAALPADDRDPARAALHAAGFDPLPAPPTHARSQHRGPVLIGVRAAVGGRRVAVSALVDGYLHVRWSGAPMPAAAWVRSYGDVHRGQRERGWVAGEWAILSYRIEPPLDPDLPATLVIADRGVAVEVDLW